MANRGRDLSLSNKNIERLNKLEIKKLDDFITQMPKDLPNNIAKARYLYLELGKRSFYDREYEYMMFGEEDTISIYSNKPYSNPNIIICTTLNKQYLELLKKAGIYAEIMQDGKHSYLVFRDEDNIGHATDLTQDLKNIQFKCSTSYFGIGSIPIRNLRELDMMLGYIDEKGYANEYWRLFRDRLEKSKLSSKQKLEITLSALQEFGDLSKLGPSELVRLYEKFVLFCIDEKQNRTFYSTKSPGKPEEYYVRLIANGKKIEYRLNPKTRLFETYREIEYKEGPSI